VQNDPSHLIPLHSHNHHEFHLILEGSCALAVRGITYHLEPGDMCITRPGEMHSMRGECQGKWSYYYAQVTDIHQVELAQLLVRAQSHRLNNCFDLIDQFAQIISEAENPGFAWESLVLSKTYSLIIQIARRLGHQTAMPALEHSQWQDSFSEVVRWAIESTCRHGLTLDEIAQTAGVSKSALTHRFASEMNESVGAYNRRIVMHRACRLLDETSMQISEIADELGFNSIHYFSAAFKKQMGMSPAAYRRSRRAGS